MLTWEVTCVYALSMCVYLQFMLELAKEKNEKPLPPIAEKNGQRLPAERYCLLANNFQIKHVKPTKV